MRGAGAGRCWVRLGPALLLACALAGAAVAAPPEPEGYRHEDYRSPTPATLAGATVLTTEQAKALHDQGAAFVDVLPRPPKPAELAPGTLWRAPPHDTIPGATWLPNTGFGDLAPETEAYFRHGLETASQGDPGRALVFFCLRDCWMSWNAAKRALALGYRKVAWYSDGVDGWREAGLPLARAEPAP